MKRRTLAAGLAGIVAMGATPALAGPNALARCRKRSATARDTVRDGLALAAATQGYFTDLEAALDAPEGEYDHETVVQYRDLVRRYLVETVERLEG